MPNTETLKKYEIEVDCKLHGLTVKHALQGHPESGTLWSNEIEGHLKDLGFVSTTHETFLYRGTYKGQEIFCSKQINDFLFSSKHKSTIRKLVAELGLKVKNFLWHVLVDHYNGIDFLQSQYQQARYAKCFW